MSDTIRVKVHRVAGHEPGTEVPVQVDGGGVPIDQFWRRRLRDAERDQCCEVVVEALETQVDESWEEEPES